MSKTKTVILSAMLGSGAMYVGLQYHVLLAPEGLLLVARSPQQSLGDTYVDVRDWNTQEWAEQPQLAVAVAKYGRTDLIGNSMANRSLEHLHRQTVPRQQQMGTTANPWEPVGPSEIPAPIANGKIANSASASTIPATQRRSFLPLSKLFSFPFGGGNKDESVRGDVQRSHGTPVLPTHSTRPPEVELLPAPDEIHLGQPQTLPRTPTSGWRQSKVNGETPKRSAQSDEKWEPLTALPTDRRTA